MYMRGKFGITTSFHEISSVTGRRLILLNLRFRLKPFEEKVSRSIIYKM